MLLHKAFPWDRFLFKKLFIPMCFLNDVSSFKAQFYYCRYPASSNTHRVVLIAFSALTIPWTFLEKL